MSSYGVVKIDESHDLGPGVHRIVDLVEKPKREEAPSNLAIIGRYILTPDIFDALETTARDRTGEIQLTNGLRQLLEKRPLYACEIVGTRHDTGNKLGFLKALVYFALQRPDLAEPFRRYLETLDVNVRRRRRLTRAQRARARQLAGGLDGAAGGAGVLSAFFESPPASPSDDLAPASAFLAPSAFEPSPFEPLAFRALAFRARPLPASCPCVRSR